ncbi:MAG: oligomeric, coiled-coil, peripheral membrane protein [Sclerophora amabilis]|nr:MAG: oligomeric, coiled-coil, peripheral membrane protein [Sclerophora amabilis]
MTTRGKQVKLQTLLTEKELFVYDRSLISPPSAGSSKPSLPDVEVPPVFTPKDPPDTLSSPTDLQAWRNLFMSRRSWALELAERCSPMANVIKQRFHEASIIERAVEIAAMNLETHVTTLEQRYTEAKTWTGNVFKEHETASRDWDVTLSRLGKIPMKNSIAQLISSRGASPRMDALRRASPSNVNMTLTLHDLVDVDELRKASVVVDDLTSNLEKQLADLGTAVEDIIGGSRDLAGKVRHGETGSMMEMNENSMRVMEDVEIVAKKVSSDYEHVLNLPGSPKSVSQASKMALLHTRNYLPSLIDAGSEMGQLHRRAFELRNRSANLAIQHLQTISGLESTLATINPQLSALDFSPEGVEAFELLALASRLPLQYGSLLIEANKRREWSEKIKVDSSNLAEELAAYKEEEERRRRKWQRSVGTLVPFEVADDKALGVEVNLQGNDQSWPPIQRQDIDDYLRTLSETEGTESIAKEITQMVADLDRPTRQQSKRAKAFKGGSVHEAAIGRSSLLLRGDDDHLRILRDEKTKIEDRLKGSESRVRKLEDLLHRQSQLSRVSSGSPFQPQSNHGLEQHNPALYNSPVAVASPRLPDDHSRRSSFSSRRFSATQGADEKAFAQRIVSMEAEIMAERELAAGLQKEVSARKETERDVKTRMEEAVSTKNDLMENLDAQQREFTDERRLLEDEISKLRSRLEEVEDELDRILGSRENEKVVVDQRVHTLETELGSARLGAAEHQKKMQDHIDSLTAENKRMQERSEHLENSGDHARREKLTLEERVRDLELELRQRKENEGEHYQALQAAHVQLSSKEAAPNKFPDLVDAIEYLAEKTASHLRDVENALAIARADNEVAQARVSETEGEVSALRDKLSAEEMESFTLREKIAREKATTKSLKAGLEEEQNQLKSLRAKFAEGETGSESLRDRLVEEEAKVTDLTSQLVAEQNRMQTLEEQFHTRQTSMQTTRADLEAADSRLESRTTRAKDLTQRLYSQNDRLRRLLEALGFVVSRRDDAMVIQRVSRTASASTTEADPASSMRRSVTASAPPRKSLEDSADLDLLYWTQANDSDAESEKYSAFLHVLGNFDLDAFSEAITKRVKETEHMARKWQKEARSYREKSHRAQLEAHEKIAFRSFKEGDLALFLPTRNQATRPWAAFNVGAPHYFLREQDSHKLRSRDWLLARISRVEERVVDLSKSVNGFVPATGDRRSIGESSDGGASFDDENPFELSDGLRWYLLDAAEEKPGAPTTPGLGKSTVASAHVDAKGSVRVSKKSVFGSSGVFGSNGGASKTLSKSLDSRRSSSNSKKGTPPSISQAPSNASVAAASDPVKTSTSNTAVTTAQSQQDTPTVKPPPTAADAGLGIRPDQDAPKGNEDVRRDLLWGP